jgi:hypothetical protein
MYVEPRNIGTDGAGSKCTLNLGTLVRMVLGVNVRCQPRDIGKNGTGGKCTLSLGTLVRIVLEVNVR